MALSVGGTFALQKALQSANTTTVVYSSGLHVSGTLAELEYDASGEAVYLKTSGPTALAYNDKELPGHGKAYHHEGFGSPIGMLRGTQVPLEHFTDVLAYVHQQLVLHFLQDWLLRLEMLEIMTAQQIMPMEQSKIRAQLEELMNSNEEIKQLIENG
jgi:hypothetical protein